MLACVGLVHAASETVYLKNGSVIKGEIIEQVPGQSLKVKTKDGNIFVYSVDEVEKITKESSVVDDGSKGAHKGLDFGVSTGVTVMSGATTVPAELILSKRFHRNLSIGLGAGVDIPTGSGDPMVPVFVDVKGYLPLSSTSITPFLDVRAGYAINTASDYTMKVGKKEVTISPADMIVASIMPGVRVPLSSRTDLDFSLGYMLYAPTSGGGDPVSAFGLRLGFNFHKTNRPVQKVDVPTRNTGLEFGFDAYGGNFAGLNLLLGYRLSKNLSVSFGAGASTSLMSDLDCFDGTKIYYSELDCKGTIVNEEPYGTFMSEDYMAFSRFFLRGEYRFTTRRFAPVASIDLGYRKALNDAELYTPVDPVSVGPKGIYFRPAVGISWRCTNNSYLQLSAGYEIGSGIKDVDTYENVNYRYDIRSERYKIKGKSMNQFSVGLTWKRTFGLFSRD